MKVVTLWFIYMASLSQATEPVSEAGSLPTAPAAAPAPQSPELPTKSTGGDTINLEDWKNPDWVLVNPKLQLFDLHGYFRTRTHTLQRLDFGNKSIWESTATGEAGIHRYPATSGSTSNDLSSDYSSANLRLRLQPTIHVVKSAQLHFTIDIFDNLILGSSPNTPRLSGRAPVDILSRSQNSDGLEAADIINVKHAYASITALNEQLKIQIGRMPNHWGLGMLFNNGACLDCDYDEYTDRLSIAFRIADHIFIAGYDWISTGPLWKPHGNFTSQNADAFSWDDISQYSLQVLRIDHPEDIRDHVLRGNTVINYGIWNSLRRQSNGLPASYYDTNGQDASSYVLSDVINQADGLDISETRDGNIYMGDAFARIYFGNWAISGEAALVYGKFTDTGINGTQLATNIFQAGAVADLTYRPSEMTGATFQLKLGGATGDQWVGLGALDAADTQRGLQSKENIIDQDLQNFQFSPNYHIDRLLFRRILGTVTDAWYFRPSASYAFTELIGGELAAIYSQAIYTNSTARCWGSDFVASCVDGQKDRKRPLGLEIDASITFGDQSGTEDTGVFGGVTGAVLFPLSGFDLVEDNADPTTTSALVDSHFAWSIEAHLALRF